MRFTVPNVQPLNVDGYQCLLSEHCQCMFFQVVYVVSRDVVLSVPAWCNICPFLFMVLTFHAI